MRVILQEKIAHLGNVGDEVTVKRGYGRNYLIPKDMAVSATEDNKKLFEYRRAELEKTAAKHLADAQARAKTFEGLSLKFEAQAGDEGKLFGSIGPRDVAEFITKAGHPVAKSEINMPEGPIRQVGVYKIGITLHGEVHTSVSFEVVSED